MKDGFKVGDIVAVAYDVEFFPMNWGKIVGFAAGETKAVIFKRGAIAVIDTDRLVRIEDKQTIDVLNERVYEEVN